MGNKSKEKIKEIRKGIKAPEGPQLPELINKLKKYPFGSDKHHKIRKAISKKIEKKYPGQFVLCVPNKFSDMTTAKSLSRYDSVTDFFRVNAISSSKTFFEDDQFSFISREEAEYNFNWKQIGVFAFITDGKDYIVLRKKEDRTITMIGGHVDYSLDAYQTSQIDILRLAIQKEVDEEIKHKKQLFVPKEPICFVNTFNKFNDLFHAAFVYKIQVNNAERIFETLKTGEPEKHDVIFISGKEKLLGKSDTHHWFHAIEKYL